MEHMGRRGLYGFVRVSPARPLGRHLYLVYIERCSQPRGVVVKGGGERTIKNGADLIVLAEEITNSMRNCGVTKIEDLKPEMVGPAGPWVGQNRPPWKQ